jgi:predicted nucleic acid-binding protein
MIVVDASVAVLGLLNDGAGRVSLATEHVAVPHLIDAELSHALRTRVRREEIAEDHARLALDRWTHLGLRRFPAVGLLGRIWELRENVTAYDATYVALAEALGCPLVTADGRLGRAPGPRCAITVLRG